jgi:hypothetical protein
LSSSSLVLPKEVGAGAMDIGRSLESLATPILTCLVDYIIYAGGRNLRAIIKTYFCCLNLANLASLLTVVFA